MRMTKKITSIVLAVMMVVSMMSVMAFSANAAVGDYVAEEDYLTFTAVEDDSWVMLTVPSGSDFKYNKNGDSWQNYNPDDYDRIWLNKGEYVRFRGSDTISNKYGGRNFSIGGKVAASGNIMSLRLDSDSRSQGLTDECFINLFTECENLTAAPELPETTLAYECYEGMFHGCKNLTTAPALPATSLAYGCYADMFMGCTSLTAAPALPATSLARACYSGMFDGCTSLTELPELPAKTLAEYCYSHMFSSCSNIRISDVAGTYSGIKYSEAYRIPTEGTATNTSSALDSMFAFTGGKFKATPNINTTYYIGKPVYTVKWKNGDNVIEEDTDVESGATPTFNGTTPEKASDTYYDYTFSGWSDGTNTYAADALPAVSGDVTYTAQYTETAKTFKVYVKKLTGGTYTIENLTGGTTVAQLKEIIADQIDIPATAQRLIFSGKTIEDAKTLAEYNIQKESTIHVVAKTYTVTWLNYDNSELGTTNVAYGAAPSYDGETPEKAEDETNTYTFSGWSDGNTTYGLSDTLPNVTADVTYTAQFTAVPKPKKLILNVGENGKVVMNGGTFGNATDASNFSEVPAPVNVADEVKVSIVDGHSLNLVEGGSINIATGGEVSFYPSADNTGVITATPAEGYVFAGWYNGDTLYSSDAALSYQNISENITLTASFTAHDPHSFENDPTFNWSQDPATGDWNCDTLTLACSCGATQNTEVKGYFGASAVTCTANTDGSFTYSVSKTVDGTKYEDSKTYDADGVIKSAKQLTAAAKKGGSWELGADIDGAHNVVCANGFVLDGKKYTVTRSTSVDTNPVFRITANPAEVTLKNLTIDGLDGRSNSKPAVATKMSNPSAGNVLNLENVKITNYDFDQANNGVVLAWGESTVNMTKCTVDTDSTYDVWGGAASTVNVSGGAVGTVYLNGGTASAELTNGAQVDNIVAFAGNTITADSGSNITPPADYRVKDNGDGTYSIVPKGINYGGDNYIKPDDKIAVSDNDEGKTKFGLDLDEYLNMQMLGIQLKNKIATAGGDDGIRFVTAVNSNLLKGSNIEDYGYIVVKAKDGTSVDKIYENMDKLTYDKVGANNRFTCKGTSNTISGDFGKFDTDTDYKYVTLALTGTGDSTDTIAARFYVKTTDGEYHYADYIDGNNQTHVGMAFTLPIA